MPVGGIEHRRLVGSEHLMVRKDDPGKVGAPDVSSPAFAERCRQKAERRKLAEAWRFVRQVRDDPKAAPLARKMATAIIEARDRIAARQMMAENDRRKRMDSIRSLAA